MSVSRQIRTCATLQAFKPVRAARESTLAALLPSLQRQIMWRSETHAVPGGMRYRLLDRDSSMSFRIFVGLLLSDREFADWYSRLLAAHDAEAFYFECRPMTAAVDDAVEFVLLDAPTLARSEPDCAPFASRFAEHDGRGHRIPEPRRRRIADRATAVRPGIRLRASRRLRPACLGRTGACVCGKWPQRRSRHVSARRRSGSTRKAAGSRGCTCVSTHGPSTTTTGPTLSCRRTRPAPAADRRLACESGGAQRDAGHAPATFALASLQPSNSRTASGNKSGAPDGMGFSRS